MTMIMPRSLDDDLLSRAFFQDPYPTHQRLRNEDPVHWCEPWRRWVVSSYEDIRAVLGQDGSAYSSVGQTDAMLSHLPPPERDALRPLEKLFSAGILWSDPPDHTRIRAIVNKALSPSDAERMRPKVERIVEQALDKLSAGQEFDLVQDLAMIVPVRVLASLLGIPDADVERFRGWADTIASFLGSQQPSSGLAEEAQACVLEARDYVVWLSDQRRARPADDVISRLVADGSSRAPLSDDEFHATVIVLLVGGHRTTTALIGNSVLALLRNPDQLAALRERPALLSSAVEEFLRYESPHQRTIRIVTEDTQIGDQPIRGGDVVVLLNGSANRDEARFSDPDRLRLDRSPNRHLSFSAGVHFCIGAPLARVEAAAAVAGVLGKFAKLELLDDRPIWLENYTLRTLDHLRLRGS